MEILGVICFMVIATCCINIIPHYTGKHLILKRIRAYKTMDLPQTVVIRNYDSSRQIMLTVFAGIIAIVCLFFYPQWYYVILGCYAAFVIIAYLLTRKIVLPNQQMIEINGDSLRLVDWNGIASPVEPKEIRYAHFYQSRLSKGWTELYPRVTLYCNRPEHRLAYAQCRSSLFGAEHGLGHEGMEYINHLHITPKEYVMLLKYCMRHHIPVEDDYATKMLLS